MILTFLKACESLTVVQFAAHRQHPFTTLLDLRHKIDEDVDFFQSSKDLAVSLLIKECSEKEVIPDYRSHVDEIALRIVGFCGIRFSLQAYFCTKTKSLARHQFFLIIWFAKDDNHFWLSVVDALTSFVHCRFQHQRCVAKWLRSPAERFLRFYPSRTCTVWRFPCTMDSSSAGNHGQKSKNWYR